MKYTASVTTLKKANFHISRGGRPVNNKAVSATTPPVMSIHQVTIYLSFDCLRIRFQAVWSTAPVSKRMMARMDIVGMNVP